MEYILIGVWLNLCAVNLSSNTTNEHTALAYAIAIAYSFLIVMIDLIYLT